MNIELFRLFDRTVVLTGGAGVLGRVYAKALLDAGASVAIVDRLEEGDMESIYLEELEGDAWENFKHRIRFYSCNITSEFEVQNTCVKILSDFDNVRVLINNASLVKQVGHQNLDEAYKPFLQMKKEDWEEYLAVDVSGAILMCQSLIPQMCDAGSGSIINISSTYGILSPDQRLYETLSPDLKQGDAQASRKIEKPIGYSVSKSAVLNLTRYLATMYGPKGIRVNTFTPGGVYVNNPDKFVSAYSERTPLRRMANRQDYIGPILFLASDASSYMTGSNLVVDGGWSAW